MDISNPNLDNNGLNIMSLDLNYDDDKKEEENDFNNKMDSLLKQLEIQLDNVKKYSNVNASLNIQDIDLAPYKISFQDSINNNNNLNQNSKNIINNNENLISINNNIEYMIKKNNENEELKDNNNQNNEINENNNNQNELITINEYDFGRNVKKENESPIDNEKVINIENIKEIYSSLKDSQALGISVQQKMNQEEKENKMNEREEKMNKKEEELERREKELLKKEKEFEEKKKKEEEEKRKIEEEKKKELERKKEIERKKEEDEEAKRDRLLNEEYERLEKIEQKKKEEEKRDNERIRKERLMKEKKEKEEEEKRKKEEELKKELEIKKKEEELQQEKELKKQIQQQKIEEEGDDEVIIEELNGDDIEELEEISYGETPKYNSKIKQNINKPNILKNNNNLKNDKKDLNNNTSDKTKKELKNSKNINPSDSSEIKKSKNELSIKKSANTNNILNNKNKSINSSLNPNNNPNNKLKNINNSPKKNINKSKINPNNQVKKPKQQKEPEKDIQISSPSAISFMKSEIYSKLNEETRNKILEYINGVEYFDTKNPDLDGINSFHFINKFEKEEKPLSIIIPKFNEKIIKKYNKEYLENKENKIISGKIIEENKKADIILTEILETPNESHMDIIKMNYEKEKLKNLPKINSDDLNNIEELEEKLFGKEEFLPEINSPFSKLENLQTFIYKYSAHENPLLMAKAIKHFNNWRITLGDGNSFYRVIMFFIIENYIFDKNIELLKVILNEMTSDKFIQDYKSKKLEYNKPFEILSTILIMLENNMEEKAYEFFLKAYDIKNGCFDMLLVIYLKRVLYSYGEEINKLLEEKMKISEDKDLFENIKINLDEIDNLYIEPNINNLYLISSLFDININLMAIYGDFFQPKTDFKIIISEDEENHLPTCVMGFFFSSFHKLYSPNLDNTIFKNVLEEDNPNITQLTFPLKNKKKCDICFKDTKHIVFLQKKFIVCHPCLQNYLSEVLKERKGYFSKDKYFGLEYYSRKIHIQDDFYLDDYEYIELFEDKNITNELLIFLNCNACDKINLKKKDLVKLKCGCIYCRECFDDAILQLTNNNGFLLECEYEKFRSKFECACKKLYSYKDLVQFVTKTDEKWEEAKKRMKEYIKEMCMICLKNLQNEEKIKKIKMRKHSYIMDHFMCIKCYNNSFKKNKITLTDEDNDEEREDEEENEDEDETRDKIKEKNKEKETNEETKKKNKRMVKLEEQKIYCNICSAWHDYKDEGESCACNIF